MSARACPKHGCMIELDRACGDCMAEDPVYPLRFENRGGTLYLVSDLLRVAHMVDEPNAQPKMTVARIATFVTNWRARLLERRNGRAELLSDEEFGQLVALNTILAFIRDS